jgi:hypothetical protein
VDTCPHCQSEPATVVRRVWFIQSFVIFARYGVRFVVGCRGCAQRAVLRNLATTALSGWWSIPWGLATPVVLAQNVVQLVVRSEDEERERLAGLGLKASHTTT